MTKQKPQHIFSCSASYAAGGLGQHLAQILATNTKEGAISQYYCAQPAPNATNGYAVHPLIPKLLPYTPYRYSPGWLNYWDIDCFDRAVAKQLPPAQIFEGFVGQSLHSFSRAQKLGYGSLRLQAVNSHVNNVVTQHQKAIQRFGIETSWLNEAQRRKTLQEYSMADIIYVASEYTRQTMLAEGIPAEKLRRIELKVHPRFQPPKTRPNDGKFRIVYVGSLTVMKGIPVLLEAFSRIADKNAELVLVGGWATRSMRRYLQQQMANDPRIQVVPGDPLPHLHQASVYVHPTYEDGFAYAAAEALACNVPVVVTEDTGMKEQVQEGITGWVISTGSSEALLERLNLLRANCLSSKT